MNKNYLHLSGKVAVRVLKSIAMCFMLFVSLVSCVWGGDEEEEPKIPFPTTIEEWIQSDQRNAEIAEKSHVIIEEAKNTATLNNADLNKLEIIEKISKLKYVDSVGLNSNETGIIIKTNDGTYSNIFLVTRDDDFFFKQTNDFDAVEIKNDISTKTVVHGEYVIPTLPANVGGTALILAPFQRYFGTDISSIEAYLRRAGYEPTPYLDGDADYTKFRGDNLRKYDIIFIATHGNADLMTRDGKYKTSVLLTGSKWEDVDVQNGMSVVDRELSCGGVLNDVDYVGMSVPWLEKITTGNFEDSWFFASACQSSKIKQGSASLVEFFIKRGVAGYNGFDDDVSDPMAWEIEKKMIELFTSSLSFHESSNAIRTNPDFRARFKDIDIFSDIAKYSEPFFLVKTNIEVLESVSFGSVELNKTDSKKFTIKNTGNTKITLSSIKCSDSQFAINYSGNEIAIGAQKEIEVVFTPKTTGYISGTITILSNAGTLTMPVSGTGVNAAAASISLSGDMGFGTVAVNTSKKSTLKIENTGTATMTVSSITLPSGFTKDWNGGPISAGSYKDVTITFTPTSAKTYSGNIVVNSDAKSGNGSIAVSGTGVNAAVSIDLSGDMAFGNVTVNSSKQATLKIKNTGTSTMKVSSITLPSGFTKNWTGGDIGAGGYKDVTITFTPTSVQTYSGNIVVNSNATSGNSSIAVSGAGVKAPAASISLTGDMAFGNVMVNSSKQATLKIRNTGNASMEVTSITLPSGFSKNWSGGTIGIGDYKDVVITFTPTSAKDYSGNIVVNSNATSGTGSIPVSGTGINSSSVSINLSGNMAFGNVTVNTSKQAILTIKNTGNAPMTVNSISTPSGFTKDWTGGTISAGSYKDVTITFTPTSAQYYSGNIVVSSNATSGNSSIAVSGTGTSAAAPQISLSGTLNFGNITVGNTSYLNFQIKNTGNAPLYISDIVCPEGYTASFSDQAIAAGSTTNAIVGFTPTSAKAFNGTIKVYSNASNGTQSISVTGTGVQSPSSSPSISLSGNMAFGSVQVNSSKTATLRIQNTGNATLTVNSISTPSGFTKDWTGGNITAGAYKDVVITFTPTSAQNYSGNIVVSSNASSGTGSIAVSGTGTQTTAPAISLTGDLSFGNVTVGTTQTKTFTIKNTGNAPLTVSMIEWPSGYTVSWSTSAIAAGNSINATVTFKPTSAISYNGVLTVYSNASNGTQTISVSGAGISATSPSISLSGSLAFGSVTVGSTSTKTLTIQNTGSATLTVNSVTCPSGFSANWTSGTISAGGSKSVTITFSPTSASNYSGNISVTSNASNGTQTIAVSGTGAQAATPTISLSGSLAFGSVTVGSTSTKTLTIQNTGSATLTVNSITCPSGFSANWTSGTIAAGSSRSVTITFSPTQATSYSGSITVSSNASNGTQSISVSGTGAQAATPTISLSGSLSFGNVNVGSSSTKTFTIQNTGNATLTVNSVSCPSGFSTNWSSGTIAAGSSRSVTITFSPTQAKSYSGSITVSSNASNGTQSISASGTGVQPAPTFTPAIGTYTACGSGSLICDGETYTAGTIKATVISYNTSTNKATFRVAKCDGSNFSSAGYMYLVWSNICISYDYEYSARKQVTAGVSYVDIEVTLSLTSGTHMNYLVYRPTNAVSGRYYTAPIIWKVN
jgi:hypothetical protein